MSHRHVYREGRSVDVCDCGRFRHRNLENVIVEVRADQEPPARDELRAFVERVAAMRLEHDCFANSCPTIGHNVDPTILRGVISEARALIKGKGEK
jgi:hypothetical protein